MQFLLVAVNAKFIHSNPAVYSLAAYAKMKNPALEKNISIAEYTINNQIEDVLADLYFRQPDVIGFSCYIWNITYIYELIVEIKKLLPNVRIWLGGPEVSFDAKDVLKKYPQITGIMIGEGEKIFLELLERYVREEQSETFSEEQSETSSEEQDFLEKNIEQNIPEQKCLVADCLTDMSEIPFLYHDLDQFKNKIIYYESSRGCPFRCSYCLSSIDKTVRLRNLTIVKQELQFFLDQKVSQVKFVDRTFNCNKKHALEIWNYLLAHDNGVTNFHFEIAADILDEEELIVLNQFRPGAVQLEIGVQSTNKDTIHEIDRIMDVGHLTKVVERIHKGHNIHIHLDLIAGLPYEDYESFGNSFNDVYNMKPEQLQLGFLKVLKGSKMHEKSADYGINYLSRPPYELLYSNWISYKEIRKLKQIEEMVEIYYNSNQFTVTLPFIISLFESPFHFFEQLAAYYERKGYFTQSPARSYRYQVLLEFIKESVDQYQSGYDSELFVESLIVDLYLRENCKTRPDFAPDLSLYKEEMRAYYQREAAERSVLGEEYSACDARTMAKMTHLEPIHYDFSTGEKQKETKYLLFDYKKRNPLTYDAEIYEVNP